MKEKILLSVIAAFLGLLVAGGAFYIYQMTRTVEEPQQQTVLDAKRIPSPTPAGTNYLTIDKPGEESVDDKRTVTIAGKVTPNSTIIVSSETADQVIKPATNGSFSLTQNIEDGVNLVQITAVFPDGQEQTITKTVTATTEDF